MLYTIEFGFLAILVGAWEKPVPEKTQYPKVAPPVVEAPSQVVVPKWIVSVAGTILVTMLLASGGWVLRTWDAPERIASLEAEVAALKDARAEEKLQDQEKIAKMQRDLALIQKDVNAINRNLDYLTSRLNHDADGALSFGSRRR